MHSTFPPTFVYSFPITQSALEPFIAAGKLPKYISYTAAYSTLMQPFQRSNLYPHLNSPETLSKITHSFNKKTQLSWCICMCAHVYAVLQTQLFHWPDIWADKSAHLGHQQESREYNTKRGKTFYSFSKMCHEVTFQERIAINQSYWIQSTPLITINLMNDSWVQEAFVLTTL